MATRPKFTEYHANAIAKEIRDLFPTYNPVTDTVDPAKEQTWYTDTKRDNMTRRGVLSALALSLAHRFEKEGIINHMKFLERCSPDNERFPITELWEDEKDEGTDG